MTTTANTSLNWINSLADSGIEADVLKYASNDVLTDVAAIQILTDVANRGPVTAAEFSSLETIAANLNNGLSTSAYVASTFDQLVNGSPANASWTAGTATPIALGNLQVGTTSTQLNELIGKWFLGTDMPNPAVTADSLVTPFLPSYSTSALPLYGASGVASMNDIAQGQLGDCEFMSGLIEMVLNHPSQLASMIVNNGNGTYGVRFYINDNETWVTVNNELPTQSGSLVYNNSFASNNTALWADIIEKAYAQLSATGEIDHPAVNSYSNISSDAAVDVLEDLTGCGAVTYYNSASSDWNTDKQIIIADLSCHDDVVVETGSNSSDTYDANGNIELVGDHAFAVTGYDSTTGDFIIRNPWGNEANQNYDTQFEVSINTIASVGGDFAVDNSSNNNSTIIVTAASPQDVLKNSSLSVGGLFKVTNSAGAPITEYTVELVGSGSIQLNGAVNLATATQTAQGQFVVSASDFSKITLVAGLSAGTTDLLVSAYDGTSWSATTDVHLTITGNGAAVISAFSPVLAASGTIALSSLFQISGSLVPGNTWYEFVLPTGSGSINLNGAQNYWNAAAGDYEFSAAQLPLVTYTAPSSNGTVTLQIDVYNGSGWSDWQNVQISVGINGAAAAVQNFANGQLSGAANVSDTAANIFANLDSLQSILSAGALQSVTLTDSTVQSEIVTGTQFDNDKGVLSIVSGNYKLNVTDLDAGDAANLNSAVASHLVSVTVTDSAANVSANFDGLEKLALSGQLTKISLTDIGTPTLTITTEQVISDAAALKDISGNYTLGTMSASDLYITPASTPIAVPAASGVLANDTDPNGLTLSATLDQTTSHGTLTLNADGSFSYAPQAGFVGTDSFTYTASDGALSSAPTTTSIVVGSLNALTSPEQLLTELYVGYYNRAPDVPGLNYWLNNYNTPPAQSPGGVNLFYQNLGQAAASFADPHQTETVTLYPFLANPQAASYSDVVTFVDAAYGNLFNRTADTLGEEYWATSIAKSLGIAVPTFGIAGIDNDAPVTAANALLALINGAQLNDAQTIANKVTAGLYYYDLLAANNVAATQASAHAAFAGVTYDPATVLASEAVTNAFVQAALHPSGANAAVATVGILDSAQSFQQAA